MSTQAPIAIATNSQRCQPAAPARKLNAAPELNASTRLMNGASTRSWPGWNAPRIRCLVAWSSAITAADSHSHASPRDPAATPASVTAAAPVAGAKRRPTGPCRSRVAARFARAEQVGHAAPAQPGCAQSLPTSARQCQQRSHFGVPAGRHRDRQRIAATHAGGGGDQHEAQVVAQRCERGVIVEAGDDVDFAPAATSRSRPPGATASSSRCTVARTARMRAHLATSASALRHGGQRIVPGADEDRRDRPGARSSTPLPR